MRSTPASPSRIVRRRLVAHPLSRAIAGLLLAGGTVGAAQAQQPFSAGWFANKGAVQDAAARTGRLPNGHPAATIGGPQRQSEAARERLRTSIDNLGAAAQAIAMQQRLQAQAREAALARPGSVPDGLGEGGLKIDENPLTAGWHNAKAPVQSERDGRVAVDIEQTGERAVLNWETFNIGRDTTVSFRQDADWAVLNRVNDPAARPSQIHGRIEADGTVLVVNRNGVVFDGASQVNVRNLVAAAARIDDAQFRERGLYGTDGAATFTDAGGAVTVEAGARIATHAPESVTQGGGYVLLLGQAVDNAGEIATPRGQAALAAGDAFAIRRGVGTEGNTTSTVRGNEVAALRGAGGGDADTGGDTGRVRNSGLIHAREGDITLTGHDVRQDGVAIATTTVNTRGTIHLLNSASDAEGRVTLGEGATTAVLIEDDGETTALDGQRDALIAESAEQDRLRLGVAPGVFDNYARLPDRRDQSRVEIVSGHDVVFEGDSTTLATGGQIAVSAEGRTFVAADATLDVSGAVGVQVSMESNTVRVNVQGNELRDSPHNRDSGRLQNSIMWVDRRDLIHVPAGTGGYASDRWYAAGGLLEVGGWLGTQGRSIGEWAAQGGTVVLRGDEVVTQAGSTVNLSGGSLDVQTGYVRQTWLRDREGRIHALQDAPAHLAYDGVYTGFESRHERWGVSDRHFSPLLAPVQRLENGYTVGRDGGTLVVDAPTAVLEGRIEASVFEGEHQTRARDAGVDGYRQAQTAVARAGGLTIGALNAAGVARPRADRIEIGAFDDIAGPLAAGDALPDDRVGGVLLDASWLNESELGALSLSSTGTIAIDDALELADGGTLDLIAPDIAVEADVTLRSGHMTAGNRVRVATQTEPQDAILLDDDGNASFSLGAGAALDLGGVWTNGARDGGESIAHVDGGALSVRMVEGSIRLGEDTLVELSSGATLRADGRLVGGRGGDLTLIANEERSFGNDPSGIELPGRELVLDGTIRAHGVTGGGTLTLQSPAPLVFGEHALLESGVLPAGTPLPADIVLDADLTLPAGTPLPLPTSVTLTRAMPDQPLPSVYPDISAGPVELAADWTVPAGGFWVEAGGAWYTSGQTIAAGSAIMFLSGTQLPAGTVLPSAAFPDGIPILPHALSMAAGETAPVEVTYVAGQVMPRGAAFAQQVGFQAATRLEPGLLDSGFSSYSVTSRAGLVVVPGTALAVTMPVLRPRADILDIGSDSPREAALERWTPPVMLEDPLAARLQLREGADLELRGASVDVGEGARIEVDPGHKIAIAAGRQLTMEGHLIAPGGDIALASEIVGRVGGLQVAALPGTSLWVGAQAVLDAAGRAWVAEDGRGHRYGLVQDGGSIRIGLEDTQRVQGDLLDASPASVVIREGALLDASGAAATVDLVAGFLPLAQAVDVAGDGGLIRLGSLGGIFNDGTLRAAAGGAGAAGGTLHMALENRAYAGEGVRTLTVSQKRAASGLAADAVAGAADATLVRDTARISVEEIEAGGFGSLDLWSRDVIAFEGDVDLSLSQRLSLQRGLLTVADGAPGAQVVLSAPHVELVGKVATTGGEPTDFVTPHPGLVNSLDSSYIRYEPSTRNHATLDIRADLVDVRDYVFFGGQGRVGVEAAAGDWRYAPLDLAGFDHVGFDSRGDIRFTDGVLQTAGDMTLTAAQLYPTSHASGEVRAGIANTARMAFDPERTLTIRGRGQAPAMPYSVFGSLQLRAASIDQGGVLRAPLGRIVLGTLPGDFNTGGPREDVYDVTLRAGSLTSTSAAGLTMPYGGTADGLNYMHAGKRVVFDDLARTGSGQTELNSVDRGVVMGQVRLSAEAGAVIDVSGGGELTGAGFFTGRGGSVDVLRTPLASANPAYAFSDAGAEVYAIVPSMQGAYAPVVPDAGAGAPQVGRQITLTEAVGELPAGTYTLMPSTYALLPGAYRVEVPSAGSGLDAAAVALPDGSVRASGLLGIANTPVRDALPTTVTLTSADAIRSLSQYNETSYAEFALAEAARFGARAPRLERDAQSLHLDFGAATGDVLDMRGEVRMGGDEEGVAGNLFLTSFEALEVKTAEAEATDGFAAVDAEDLARFLPGTLTIGGLFGLIDARAAPELGGHALGPRVVFRGGSGDVAVREGAHLRAGQIFLTSTTRVDVDGGAVLEAIDAGPRRMDSVSGYVFSDTVNDLNATGGAILAVTDGDVRFAPPTVGSSASSANAIRIADGAALRSPGTIAFSTNGTLDLGDAEFNARYLALSAPTLHLGTEASFARAEAAGALGPGVRLSQSVLDRLMRPAAPGQVPAERLSLSVSGSINLFGDVDVDLARGGDGRAQLWLATPALYGWGEVGETARLAADTVIWSGLTAGAGAPDRPYVSLEPSNVAEGGPGTGRGTLAIEARRVEFGYLPGAQAQDQIEVDRVAAGFAGVDIRASERITANHRGTLSVHADGRALGSGGDLRLSTPLLTGEAGAFMAYRAGGEVSLVAPEGALPVETSGLDDLGAEVRLAGERVRIDGTVALPSGRLVLEAAQDIDLSGRARVDLSGRVLQFFDATRASWGGDLVMESAQGAIRQAAGSRIDVSATDADAGTVQVTARGGEGRVTLAGALLGAGGAGRSSGEIDLRAHALEDFAGLNRRLDQGGFHEARSFAVGSGDLVIDGILRARRVAVSADGGSLTVTGRIDASGEAPGDIRLAARDDLLLASGALLDARSTRLQVDGRGDAIGAANRARVSLTSSEGRVSLAEGTTIDVRAADGIARGRVELNAGRVGGDDVAVDAAGRIDVRGAEAVAVNAFRTYVPDDGRIDQAGLDLIHLDSTAFIDAALANDALAGRLAGLSAYGDAFALRPGVELRSATPDGDLIVDGDLDLSGYRYGPDADPDLRGSGDPGMLVVRAGGDLRVTGSINDGFAPPPATPDDAKFVEIPGQTVQIPAGTTRPDVWWLESNLTIDEDWQVPDTPFYQNWEGYVYDINWNLYSPGAIVPAGTTLMASYTAFEANTALPAYTLVEPTTYESGRVWAAAPMLAPGLQSWSMRLVGGADLGAADSRLLAAASALNDRGHVVLDAPGRIGPQHDQSPISVIRTGTGDLDVLAGGDYRQHSLYGVYTAGTQVADGSMEIVAPRALAFDGSGSVLGWGHEGYEATLDPQRMFLPDGGGDLLLAAQGDIRGRIEDDGESLTPRIGEWLWRQGGEALGQATAWGINFGQYHSETVNWSPSVVFGGFAGIGTLGGGNVELRAGGNVGAASDLSLSDPLAPTEALLVAVGASGRVDTRGRLIQYGGGDLRLRAGGRVNTGLIETIAPSVAGMVVNVRGDIDVRAAAIGQSQATGYGINAAADPRPVDTSTASRRIGYAPLALAVGDGEAYVAARGGLHVATGVDPGRVVSIGGGTAVTGGAGEAAQAVSSFSLWTERSGLDLFAAGGDIVQTGVGETSFTYYDPGRFSAVAAGGSIQVGSGAQFGQLLLAPSPQGRLELLARDHVRGEVAASGGATAATAALDNPFWAMLVDDFATVGSSNAPGDVFRLDVLRGYTINQGATLFPFGPDTATAEGAGGVDRVYSLTGDVALSSGRIDVNNRRGESYYVAARPLHLRAGRDVVGGSHVILNRDSGDISLVRAGRDLLNTSVRVAGPGLLDIGAGRSIYQAPPSDVEGPAANLGVFQSLGAVVPGDTLPGAGIVLSAGLGAAGPDLDGFAARYLDPANLADSGRPLADQPGMVAHTYQDELIDWLEARYGDAGDPDTALARFQALPDEERAIFLRDIYFEELRQAGREYNDPDSGRFRSYLRGREAIASFLPGMGEGDEAGDYMGSIVFQEAAGVHTYGGGDIQVLAPGGGLTLGADGVAPPASTGLMTQGRGDIEVFTRDSVLLGLSRVFTTFGGSITMWSAEGDINAGRGANTSVVYTPPRRVYDDLGNVSLSPQAPTTGAGIATLNPIAEVEPGDIDLIAPLGTIDAGEAGIRVSGNVNLAALQVLNAENIQVQGESTGLPATASVNVAALTAASAAANSAVQAAQDVVRQQTQRARPSVIDVRVLGFGDGAREERDTRRDGASAPALRGYDPGSAFQVLGHGALDDAQRARLTTAERRALE
ncbi:filamentous haemagglutinin family protein [Luteimonas huabeiensis]|uniref:filamentous haemagglutinin family protein n=1 Tax=Luteimonas huabeiensis TaxID=1244513 RepID=UPI000467DA4D|nr:filamentous haemagglutinin family protein [Luteimonas huabeiensis]